MTKRFTYLMKSLQKSLHPGNGSEMDRDFIGNGSVRMGHHNRALAAKTSRNIFAVLILLLTLGVGQMWGAENDTHDFSQSLSQLLNNNASISGINILDQGYPIKSIIITCRYNKDIDPAVTIAITVGGAAYASSQTVGDNFNSTKTFTGNASGAVAITFTNETGSGNGHGTFYVTNVRLVEGSSCAKSVTINKGTATNCSFTLSKSGAQASCDGVSTTVTVSPSTGYGNASVTQSGASAAPTISGSGTSWTVAYGSNTTGTSTIAVSCSANNYTITLDKDLTPTTAGTATITATYNSNSNLTSAITTPTKTGWTFAGYFTAKNGGGTQIINASGNVIANANDGGSNTYTDASGNWKYPGNITLYAKWTCTVTWSVNGLTNVYSAHTLTYNGTSTKIASVPGPPSPATYCGDKFVGWTDAAIDGSQNSAPSTLFTTAASSPELKTVGNTTFYAVFADYDE